MTRAALLKLAAVLLPLAGLGAAWAQADRSNTQGTIWEVPVHGYDPLDRLQGHYVQFQISWPGLVDADGAPRAAYDAVCLSGQAPQIDQAVEPSGGLCANRVNRGSARNGRLYASQAAAERLQEQLWDDKLQGVLRFRLRPDGQIVPLEIAFHPRPASAKQQVAGPGSVEPEVKAARRATE